MTVTLWNLLLYALLAAVALALPRPLNWIVSCLLVLIVIVDLFDLGFLEICAALPQTEPIPSLCQGLPNPGAEISNWWNVHSN